MNADACTLDLTRAPAATPWRDPASWWPALTEATADIDPPFGVLAADALAWNAHDLLRRAAGMPIRVASKSIRVRAVLDAVLALPGYAGVLAYTLPEALWLAGGEDGARDVLVGYPSADRAAILELARSAELASRVTLMVDDLAQLDLVDDVVPPSRRPELRVCLELDASYRHRLLGHLGTRRSPVHRAERLRRLAVKAGARRGFRLVGVMAYEAQIAGVGNAGNGRGRAVRGIQRVSAAELAHRRGAAVAAVREVADLEFVNGGGTGSIESTRADPCVTEVAAGSGLFGPRLFDGYAHFCPAPAASFALSVVRRPAPQLVTLLGGGWTASGPPGRDRAPHVAWPPGLTYLGREGAGEVQTPLRGDAAQQLRLGDRVWLRHAKAGELSEHLEEFVVVRDDGARRQVVGRVPTYRGQGKAFL